MNKTKEIILLFIGIFSLLLITAGVTYSIFTYTRTGTTDNIVTSGTLKFLYTENVGVGAGISLVDAIPVSDTVGKSYSTENYVFDFKVEGTNTSVNSINYEVTLRKKSDSSLPSDAVKVYLTDMTDGADTELLAPNLYSNLVPTTINVGEETEVTLYKGSILSGQSDYVKNFRLRMWIDENVDLSDENYGGKTFSALVNVYADVKMDYEEEVASSLKEKIMDSNTLITTTPTLSTSSNNTSDTSGLYASTDTNTGDVTYYFRGNVENNYVDFAGFTWRIIRINEDGTIRMIMQDGISDNALNPNYNSNIYMYYSNSNVENGAKKRLDNWYTTNIFDKGYSNKLVTGDYYCEQAKAAYNDSFANNSGANMILYSNYTPSFKCQTDENGKGIVNSNIGLITYDEVVYAGGYPYVENQNYYLYNGTTTWTMSPAGFSGSIAYVWRAYHRLSLGNGINARLYLRAVVNLKSDTSVTGMGTITNPYVVK